MARGCCGCHGLGVCRAGTGALQWEEGQGTRHKKLEFKALIAFFFFNLVVWGGVMGPCKSVPAVVLVFFLFFFFGSGRNLLALLQQAKVGHELCRVVLLLLQHVGGSSPLAAHGRALKAVGLAGESKIMIMESSVLT